MDFYEAQRQPSGAAHSDVPSRALLEQLFFIPYLPDRCATSQNHPTKIRMDETARPLTAMLIPVMILCNLSSVSLLR